MLKDADLLSVVTDRLRRDSSVKAVVLFGSRARPAAAVAAADGWSDIDMHVITSAPDRLQDRAWAQSLPGQELCLHVVRPASGGVRKATLLYSSGEVDLVLLPAGRSRCARLLISLGLHRRIHSLRTSLNLVSTIMQGGYRFLKGEKQWGGLYARVVADMPGYRLNDREIDEMADIFLCDLLWVLQKIERGELVAAQRILHRSLAETNVVLLHELRTRRAQVTFQQARRVEHLLAAEELSMVAVSTRLEATDLRNAASVAFLNVKKLMAELNPDWRVPELFSALLAPHTVHSPKQ